MRNVSMIAAIALAVALLGCTDNQRAKDFGGTATIDLPAGEKLVNATWKNSDLWVLTRPRRADESAEDYTLQEYSDFGILNGTVEIHEK